MNPALSQATLFALICRGIVYWLENRERIRRAVVHEVARSFREAVLAM